MATTVPQAPEAGLPPVLDAAEVAGAPPHPLAEFWHYFRQNHGAVAGLAIVVLLALVGIEYRETWRAYFRDYVRFLPGHNYAISLELARVLDGFITEGPAYIKDWPYWYDGNAVRAQLKVTPREWDWHLSELDVTQPPLSTVQGPVLVIVHPEDRQALAALRSAFPKGVAINHRDNAGQVAFITFYGER